MSQFNTTPLSYTGGEFTEAEKAQFRVDWDLMKADNTNFSLLQIGGTTVIDASRNISAGSGSFSNAISAKSSNTGSIITRNDNFTSLFVQQGKASGGIANFRYGSTVAGGGTQVVDINSAGINVTGNVVASGTVTAAGYLPFTGCHIAKSEESLQLGELVQIKSVGWINDKQPDWEAEYCNGSKKGVYGVVYDIQIVDVMEDYIATDKKQVSEMVTSTETKTAIKFIDGEYQEVIESVEVEEEVLLFDEFPIKGTDKTHKVARMEDIEVTKQRKIGEETIYHIAATGDGFINIDCACEYGDVLIPSETKGLATVYQGKYLPLNMVGFAGEDSKGGKIAYTKE